MDGTFIVGGGMFPVFPPIGCGLNCPGIFIAGIFGDCLLESPPMLKSIFGRVGLPLG